MGNLLRRRLKHQQHQLFVTKQQEFPGVFANNGTMQSYERLQSLGCGVDGEVFKVVDDMGVHRAMKVINLKRFATRFDRKQQQQSLLREIQALQEIDHPNVVRIVDLSMQNNNNSIAVVMDLCEGGTLTKSREQRLTSIAATQQVLFQIASAIRYIHSRKIAHRDIKPDNIMFTSPDPSNLHVCLIDFGVATKLVVSRKRKALTRMHGTPYYMSPQVVECNYGLECDLWSLGVLSYQLLCDNMLPFDAPSIHLLFKLILHAKVDYLHQVWVDFPLAKDMVEGLLVRDVSMRWNAEQVYGCAWFQPLINPKQAVVDNEHSVVHSLERFAGMTKFEKMTRMVVAHQHSGAGLVGLRTTFQALDVNGSGVIDLEELRTLLSRNGMNDEDVHQCFTQIDVDASGHVQLSELVAAALDTTLNQENDNNKLASAFAFIGQGNEYITTAHLKQLLGSSRQLGSIMNNVDSNGDGKISKQEFLAATQRV